MTALFWIAIAGGYWGENKGHWESAPSPDMVQCEEARPVEEAKRRAAGQVVLGSKCIPIKDEIHVRLR